MTFTETPMVSTETAVPADPFYSESNLQYLEQKMADYKAGTLSFATHELIED